MTVVEDFILLNISICQVASVLDDSTNKTLLKRAWSLCVLSAGLQHRPQPPQDQLLLPGRPALEFSTRLDGSTSQDSDPHLLEGTN